MKVLLVSEPGVDGVFRHVEALVHYLVEQEVSVHLAYSDRRGSDQLHVLVDFVRRHGGLTLNLSTGNRPAWSDLPAFLALHRLVRRVRPDVIHSHSSKAGVLARLLPAPGFCARHVYQPHAYSGMRRRSPVTRIVYDNVERLLGRRGMTINCSEDEQSYALYRLRLPVSRTVCLPNGIDTRHFSPATPAEKRTQRLALGLPPTAPILGTLGRAAPQKDPITLYRAFVRALARDPDLVLCHVGCGELDRRLNRFIEENHLATRILRRAFLATPVDFYRAIDGFALTSLYEGLSLAALEALACDLPLILSEAPGNRDLLRLPLSHLHSAPVADIDGFARAIGCWAGSQRAPRRPSNHRLIACACFDSRIRFARLLELYRQVATPAPESAASPMPPVTAARESG